MSTPPPVPPNLSPPTKQHWSDTFWFCAIVLGVPVLAMVGMAVAGIR